MSSSGDRIHNQSILQSHFVPMRNDWPGNIFDVYTRMYEILFQNQNHSIHYSNIIILFKIYNILFYSINP